jgi:tetratricopeptide (TPR) repeat protein
MPRLRLFPLRLLYLLYAIAAVTIVLRMGLSRYVSAAIVIGPLVAVEGLLRLLMAPKVKNFGNELLRLMQQGEDDALLPYYDSQRLLRFAAPSYEMTDKLGLIYAHLGNFEAAADAYRDALDAAPGKRQVEIAIKLADALRMSGQLAEAERFYREVVAVTDEHPPSSQHLARLILDRGADPNEALEVLRRAEKQARQDAAGGQLRVELARLLITYDELAEAESLLKSARKAIVAAGDATREELVEQAEQALEAARRS